MVCKIHFRRRIEHNRTSCSEALSSLFHANLVRINAVLMNKGNISMFVDMNIGVKTGDHLFDLIFDRPSGNGTDGEISHRL